MKDKMRDPIVYYVAVPIFIALWPLLLWQVYLPGAHENLKKETANYTKARQLMEQILTLDPTRLDFKDSEKAAEFDYAVAVDQAARKLQIPAASYTISSKSVHRGSGGQKTQSCQIIISEIGIARFAQFLSALQLTWANLQCEEVTLTKNKGLPDSWKVDLTLRYYY